MRLRAGLCVVFLAATLALVGCTRANGPSDASASGTLSGRIVRGPTSPVGGPGAPAPGPSSLAGAEIRIVNLSGRLIATARADASGSYRVTLPAGEYRLERGAGFSGATKNLPARVAISPGGQTRFDVWVDTGIR